MKVNSHLHTPYSFSAFEGIPQALDMAASEGVKVVGINDFYTTDGYAEWERECAKRKLFPLFNIEFISLNLEDQQAGLRVNDPGNPGRTYLSGKGLSNPVELSDPYRSKLENVRNESNAHVGRMCAKLNQILAERKIGITLDFGEITKNLTKGSIRERHLAKALRMAVQERCCSESESMAKMFEIIFGCKPLKSAVTDSAAVENEIRGNLLKAGGAAFVAEEPKAFLPMEDVRQIILRAGGIPTYPFLGDDANGGFTDFEADLPRAVETLKRRGIFSAEFITTRNSIEVLERYAQYLYDNGFIVTFGSEHNTPAMEPITLFARNSTPLTPKLLEIGYKGACVIAAHQAAVADGEQGYVDCFGKADIAHRDEYEKRGNELIQSVVK